MPAAPGGGGAGRPPFGGSPGEDEPVGKPGPGDARERREEAFEVLVGLVVPEEEDVRRVEAGRAANAGDVFTGHGSEKALLHAVRDGAHLRRVFRGEGREVAADGLRDGQDDARGAEGAPEHRRRVEPLRQRPVLRTLQVDQVVDRHDGGPGREERHDVVRGVEDVAPGPRKRAPHRDELGEGVPGGIAGDRFDALGEESLVAGPHDRHELVLVRAPRRRRGGRGRRSRCRNRGACGRRGPRGAASCAPPRRKGHAWRARRLPR